MNIYKNFNEEELLIAYNELLDNSGKINRDMQEVLSERGYDEEFFAKANHKKFLLKKKEELLLKLIKWLTKMYVSKILERKFSKRKTLDTYKKALN